MAFVVLKQHQQHPHRNFIYSIAYVPLSSNEQTGCHCLEQILSVQMISVVELGVVQTIGLSKLNGLLQKLSRNPD